MITQTQRILHDAHIARLRRFEQRKLPAVVAPVAATILPAPAPTAPVAAISLPAFLPPRPSPTWPPTTQEIQDAVATFYDVSRELLLSSCRHAWITYPRQVAMYLTRALAFRSYSQIGHQFGGRDHTTVLFAVKKIERLRHTIPALADAIATITASLRGAAK